MIASEAKIAYGTDCGMFPFSHGILEFQAMVERGPLARCARSRPPPRLPPQLLGRNDLGVLAPGKRADIVAMPGDPIADIAATAESTS